MVRRTPQSDTPAENKKRRAYKISVKRAKITFTMFLSLICIVLLFMSPLFNIKTVYVKGNKQLSTEAVMKAATFSRGDNIFSIDISESCEKIEKLPRVDGCKIERDLPGKVTINVNEKTESGYIKTKSGYAGISERGKILVVTKTTEAKCPVVTGLKIIDSPKGDYIKAEEEKDKSKTSLLIKILTELEDRELISHVKNVNIKDTDAISLTLVTDTLVNLGSDGKENKDKIEYKIAFLKAILDEDYPKHGGIIELSDTSNVTGRVQ